MDRKSNARLYALDAGLGRRQALDELTTMPERLRSMLRGRDAAALGRFPAPGEWTAFQTVCHLRDAALVYAMRFRFIVFNHDPFLPDYDEKNWVMAAHDESPDLPRILGEVAASRGDLIRVLNGLDDAAWARTGRHEVNGVVVLEDYVRHQVVHERMHLSQLQMALGT